MLLVNLFCSERYVLLHLPHVPGEILPIPVQHFVVYKVPAIVGAIAAYTDCDIEFSDKPGLEVIDERPAVPGYKAEKKVSIGFEFSMPITTDSLSSCRMRATRLSGLCSGIST